MNLIKLIIGLILIISCLLAVFYIDESKFFEHWDTTSTGKCYDGLENEIITPVGYECLHTNTPQFIQFISIFCMVFFLALTIMGGILGLQGLGIIRE
jgi:hypothetical protein